MTRQGWSATAAWVLAALAAAVVVARAHYTADLSAFLPRTPTPTQRMLIDQLREGVASRLILIGIEGGDVDARGKASRDLARELRGSGLFAAVNNGEPVGVERDQQLLFGHRYVLSDAITAQRFTPAGLRDAIQESLDLLASPAGLLAKSLLPHDPTGEMLQIIDQVGAQKQPPLQAGVWGSHDGKRALLVAQTRAAGSDTDGQEQAVHRIQQAFDRVTPRGGSRLSLEMSGPGVFSVAARATIKQEVTKLSILSTALITALLLAVYRSVPALVLGFVPVASGALAGVAAVALGFGLVHGITLGFGVTLIGESVDYSIYLFIQSMRAPQAADSATRQRRSLWPTILLGVLTSVAGFASLLPSAFPGLAQLGLFSIGGLIAAALVTRFVLPHLLPRTLSIRDVTPLGVGVAAAIRRIHAPRTLLLVIPVLAALVLYGHRGSIWNRELSALSPVSGHDQALDALLRTDIGAPDARYIVIVSGPDQESVLESAEKLAPPLEALVEQNVIAGFDSPARFLPSLAAQRARRASLPEARQLRTNLQTALQGLPLKIERLQPFLDDVEAAREQAPLERGDLAGTSLETGVDALVLREGSRWSVLLPLRAPAGVDIDVSRVHSAVSTAGPAAVVLDVKSEADQLYSTYLSEVLKLSAAGLVAIVVLLLVALRSPLRVLRVVAPLVLAVSAVAAGLVLLGREMTILHIIGMLLIVAVGSNYALFFDRQANDPHAGDVPLTLASLVIANAATVVGFGVLAFSQVPVLAALGSTVAPGALLALIFSALLAKDLPTVAVPARTGAAA